MLIQLQFYKRIKNKDETSSNFFFKEYYMYIAKPF